jgi:ferredoxin
MKASVNENCIGCGACESICPEVFQLTEQGVAKAVGDVPEKSEALAAEARDNCPVDAIHID